MEAAKSVFFSKIYEISKLFFLFFNFLLQSIGDYLSFIKVPAEKKIISQDDFFDFDGFLKWHKNTNGLKGEEFIK